MMRGKFWVAALAVALVAMAGGPLFARPGGGGGGHSFGGGGGHSFGGGGGWGGHSYGGGGWGAGRSYSAPAFRYSSPALSSGSFATRSFATPGVVGAHNFGTRSAFVGNSGNWAHNGWWNNNWGRGFGRGYHGFGFGPYWGYGLYGYGNPWWYAGAYPYYGYDSYYPYYAYDYAGLAYPVTTADYTAYAAEPTVATTDETAVQEADQPATSTEGQQFADEALEAFKQGNYRDALRFGGHAAIEMPRNARIHELLSLALFALKDYRGAAMEAHAAVAMGPISDWDHLYSYYGNVDTYTTQLQALVDYAHSNPSSADARFLLGYHDLMMGHTAEGKQQLAQAIAMAPQDKLAEQMLKQLGGTPTTTGMPPTSSTEPQTPSSTEPQPGASQPTISRGRVY